MHHSASIPFIRPVAEQLHAHRSQRFALDDAFPSTWSSIVDEEQAENNCHLVGVVGPTRTGKSSLMNFLVHAVAQAASTAPNAPLGRTRQQSATFPPNPPQFRANPFAVGNKGVVTKGAQILSSPLTIANSKVFLVDFEGVGDQDTEYDAQLTGVALSICEVILFNFRGRIGKTQILNELALFSNYFETVNGRAKCGPHLHLVFRDWTSVDSSEEYRKELFDQEPNPRNIADIDTRNQWRQSFTGLFASVSVSVFPHPAPSSVIEANDSLSFDVVKPEFKQNVSALLAAVTSQVASTTQRTLNGVICGNAKLLPRACAEILAKASLLTTVGLDEIAGLLMDEAVFSLFAKHSNAFISLCDKLLSDIDRSTGIYNDSQLSMLAQDALSSFQKDCKPYTSTASATCCLQMDALSKRVQSKKQQTHTQLVEHIVKKVTAERKDILSRLKADYEQFKAKRLTCGMTSDDDKDKKELRNELLSTVRKSTIGWDRWQQWKLAEIDTEQQFLQSTVESLVDRWTVEKTAAETTRSDCIKLIAAEWSNFLLVEGALSLPTSEKTIENFVLDLMKRFQMAPSVAPIYAKLVAVSNERWDSSECHLHSCVTTWVTSTLQSLRELNTQAWKRDVDDLSLQLSKMLQEKCSEQINDQQLLGMREQDVPARISSLTQTVLQSSSVTNHLSSAPPEMSSALRDAVSRTKGTLENQYVRRLTQLHDMRRLEEKRAQEEQQRRQLELQRQEALARQRRLEEEAENERRRQAEIQRQLWERQQQEAYLNSFGSFGFGGYGGGFGGGYGGGGGGGRQVFTGPRGGQYYINSNGNKSYLRK